MICHTAIDNIEESNDIKFDFYKKLITNLTKCLEHMLTLIQQHENNKSYEKIDAKFFLQFGNCFTWTGLDAEFDFDLKFGTIAFENFKALRHEMQLHKVRNQI